MRRVVSLLLLLSGASVVAAPAPLAKPARSRDAGADLREMQGEWEWQPGPWHGVERVVIRGDSIVWCAGTRREETETFRLYPTTTPKGMDTTRPRHGTSPCIYSLRGDVLIIRETLTRTKRPSSFDGQGDVTYTLRRRR